MQILEDSFGRRFSYLRLSITDACNFSCQYCLPNGYCRTGAPAPLTPNETSNLVAAFAELGTWKVRLTGGEPTLRRDLLEIVDRVVTTPGVRRVALSTNGYRLRELARPLFDAGVRGLNTSVDSLDRAKFFEITGVDKLPDVLEGIDAAFDVGFEHVKVNAVLLAGLNDTELDRFSDWVRTRPITVRFIELMPTASNQDLFKRRHARADAIRARLLTQGWAPRMRSEGDGPAEEFTHPEYVGRIGIIAPYSKEFCKTCNRLRVTSQGALRLCLFAKGEVTLRDLLREPLQREELKARLIELLATKEVSHYLPEGKYGNTGTFSAIGG
ncbi:MAG: GTP 3',8-cyclase MoaA [Deltaproteobacteria bacterium]|nr:GTP 3',8-cyclase MoaA [Deltaproteobacteria bacterium]